MEEIKDISGWFIAAGLIAVPALLGGTMALRMYLTNKYFVKKPEQERKKIEDAFKNLQKIGGMYRLYLDGITYKDNRGNEIPALVIHHEVKNIKPTWSSERTQASIDDIIDEIKKQGEQSKADTFSFSGSKIVHGDYVFGVLYHKTK